MNTNEQHFFDLSMKVIAGHANAAEQAEHNALLAGDPKLQAEYEQLKMDAELTKEILPLVDATEATTGKLPDYARERLRTKVRQTLGVKRPEPRSTGWLWWLWVPAAAVVVVALLINKPATPALPPMIQLAMLDSVGSTRGSASKPLTALQQQWKDVKVREFDDAAQLKHWQEDWSAAVKQPVVKIVYNRDSQEVSVTFQVAGKREYEQVYRMKTDEELSSILAAANEDIRRHYKR